MIELKINNEIMRNHEKALQNMELESCSQAATNALKGVPKVQTHPST
jgi:hypothetical protein